MLKLFNLQFFLFIHFFLLFIHPKLYFRHFRDRWQRSHPVSILPLLTFVPPLLHGGKQEGGDNQASGDEEDAPQVGYRNGSCVVLILLASAGTLRVLLPPFPPEMLNETLISQLGDPEEILR